MIPRAWVALLLALSLFWAESALAATVALLKPSSSSPRLTEALYRLQGELMAVGLDVEIVERPPRLAEGREPSHDELEPMASERDLAAIIDVSGDENPISVDIWLFQRSPRRFELVRVLLDPTAQRPSEALAIRAIEALRSSFLELDLSERARPEKPAQSQPSREQAPLDQPSHAAPRALQRWGLEAGAAVVSSVNGVGPALLPLARFGWVATPRLVTQATFAGLGTRPAIETELGSAEVAQHFALLGACYCRAPAMGIRPAFSLSAGVLRTSLDGRAELPAHGHHVVRWSLLVDASVGARFPLSEHYYASLAAHAQLAEPYVAVHFADTTVATIGRPNLLFTVTLGAWL